MSPVLPHEGKARDHFFVGFENFMVQTFSHNKAVEHSNLLLRVYNSHGLNHNKCFLGGSNNSNEGHEQGQPQRRRISTSCSAKKKWSDGVVEEVRGFFGQGAAQDAHCFWLCDQHYRGRDLPVFDQWKGRQIRPRSEEDDCFCVLGGLRLHPARDSMVWRNGVCSAADPALEVVMEGCARSDLLLDRHDSAHLRYVPLLHALSA